MEKKCPPSAMLRAVRRRALGRIASGPNAGIMYSWGTKNRAKGFRVSKKKSEERVREEIGDHGGSPRPNIAGIHRLSDLQQRRARNRASVRARSGCVVVEAAVRFCPPTALRKDFRLAPARPSIGANLAGRAQQFRETPQ